MGVYLNLAEHWPPPASHYRETHDGLTGLCNRHELERKVGGVIEAEENDGTEHALWFMDMDQFKVVNDACCNSGGDELLRQFADLLRKQVRSRNALARLGGDEFAVLLEHCSIDQAHRAVSGLRESICYFKFESLGRTFQLGASIGVVLTNKNSGGLEQVMSDAILDMLHDIGLDFAQGYRIGKPVPIAGVA